MEERSVQDIIQATHWTRIMAATAFGMLALFLLVATVAQLRGLPYIGSGVAATNTISVSGEGDVYAIPDTAEFSFTVSATGKDVATAQTTASTNENAIVAYLKAQGVADTDVQTTDYEVNPQYQYQNTVCPEASGTSAVPVYCPPGNQVLTGYQVSETITVKVEDTTKAGTLLSGVGSKGATNVSGLSFIVSNQDALENQARGKAITAAQAKAQTLASQLGVSLVRVVGFSENANTPQPVYYAKAEGATMSAAAPAPALPTGQNEITSDVTITYEVR